jgi:hypothetical protein
VDLDRWLRLLNSHLGYLCYPLERYISENIFERVKENEKGGKASAEETINTKEKSHIMCVLQ